METHGAISDDIETYSLESFRTDKIKIFNKEECFKVSNQAIVEIHKDQ